LEPEPEESCRSHGQPNGTDQSEAAVLRSHGPQNGGICPITQVLKNPPSRQKFRFSGISFVKYNQLILQLGVSFSKTLLTKISGE
jgi:hypothetical protein